MLADGACLTVFCSYQLDVGTETELGIKDKELLFDDAYLSQVVDHKKSWFTRMDVLDLIYHQFFFTANRLGHQPTSSQYFQPLTPQTWALAAAAIRYALSEHASGKKATVMFSQDEYQGIFGPSLVVNFTLEATTQSITHQRQLHPPPPLWRNSTRIGAPQYSSELLSLDWTSSMSFHSQFLLFQRSSIQFCTPYPPLPMLLSSGWKLFNSHWGSYNAFYTTYAPLFGGPLLD